MTKSFTDKLQSVLRYPEMIEAIADVLDYGVSKGYPDENWLKPDGKTMSKKANFDSKNHHAAKHFAGQLYDESGLYHLAHEGTRALMELTRLKRGIVHTDDQEIDRSGICCLPPKRTQLEVALDSLDVAANQLENDVFDMDDELALWGKEMRHKYKSHACDTNQCRCKKDE